MGINRIEYKGDIYPAFQAEGFASKFAFPFAKQVCKGNGADVGCMKPSWAYRSRERIAIEDTQDGCPYNLAYEDDVYFKTYLVDPSLSSGKFHALNFPEEAINLDFVFSSHCLEHVDRWVDVLDYWLSKIKSGGTLFLYLPDFSQKYWRGWNNRKHVNMFTPEIISAYFDDNNLISYHKVSGIDLNNSFMLIAEKV